jgi:hypothetical protein
MMIIAYLMGLGFVIGTVRGCIIRRRENNVKAYYMVLTAVRPSTMSKRHMLDIVTGRNKHEALGEALEDFQESMGPSWHVQGQIVTQQYFDMRVAVEMRQEQLLLRGEGGV